MTTTVRKRSSARITLIAIGLGFAAIMVFGPGPKPAEPAPPQRSERTMVGRTFTIPAGSYATGRRLFHWDDTAPWPGRAIYVYYRVDGHRGVIEQISGGRYCVRFDSQIPRGGMNESGVGMLPHDPKECLWIPTDEGTIVGGLNDPR